MTDDSQELTETTAATSETDAPQAIGTGDDSVKPSGPVLTFKGKPIVWDDDLRAARAPRCDCPALPGPHTHEPSGPVSLDV